LPNENRRADPGFRIERLGCAGTRRCDRLAPTPPGTHRQRSFPTGWTFTVEDIANRLFNCGERTVTRDIKALKDKGICLPLRSTVRDMGRSISHREMIVREWLLGKEFSEISRQTNHSIEAVANYVEKFKRVICLAKDNREIKTIAFLVKISVPLAQQYYDLYQTLDIIPSREKELDELIKKRLFNTKKFF
jgi:hypothetical protein